MLLRSTSGEDARSSPRNSRLGARVVVLTVMAVGLILGGAYAAAYAMTSDRLPRGTTVGGVDVGGLTREEAVERLGDGLEDTLDDPVVVAAGGLRRDIDPDRAGLSVDVEASVDAVATGRSWDPRAMWQSLTGGDDHPVVVAADDAALEAELRRVADAVARSPRDGSVELRGTRPVTRDARDGLRLDVDAAAQSVRAAYPSTGERVPLATTAVEPDITDDEVRAAMDELVNPAVSAPVVFVIGGEDVVLRPRAYAPALSVRAVDGELALRVMERPLLRALRPAMRTVAARPQDATVALVGGRPRVIPAKTGVSFDQSKIVPRFLDLVVAEGQGRRTRLGTVTARPEFTTREARALHVREVVSQFTTYYPHADYRNNNIGRAASLINGTLLKPGETFSLNQVVGERTVANGFVEGFVISGGLFREELGGGVSQVATTTFNAAFFAGLEDVEHKPHSVYISRYPEGREATVAWPTVDLQFTNDTPHGILIEAWRVPSSSGGQGSMNVRMWSTKVWDIQAATSPRYAFTDFDEQRMSGEDCVPNDGYGGFSVDVERLFYRVGSSVLERREPFHTVYNPSDTVICEPEETAGP